MMTFLELCCRYNVKKAAFSRWLNRHRKEIDPKNQEIQKIGKVLIFSENAIDKIDKIRNFAVCSDLFAISEPEPEPEAAAADQEVAAENKELKNTIDNLKTQVLILQNKIIQSQEQTIAAAAALNAATTARLEAVEEKAQKDAEINLLRQEIEMKDRELDLLREVVQNSASQRRRGNRWWR